MIYSRSILDYTLERLTGARLQLINLKLTNALQSQIDNRPLAIVEPEHDKRLWNFDKTMKSLPDAATAIKMVRLIMQKI